MDEKAGVIAESVKPKRNWDRVWSKMAVGIFIVGLFAVIFNLLSDLNASRKETLVVTNELNIKSSHEAELSRKLGTFSKHEMLMNTVASRDMAADSLWGWMGRTVMLKYDSSKVVVSGVFFGGGRYDHRIWCEVTNKDGTTMNVNPELISAQ